MGRTTMEYDSLKEVLEALHREVGDRDEQRETEQILILGCHPSRPKHAFTPE